MDLNIQTALTPIRVQQSMNEAVLCEIVFSLLLIKVLIISGKRAQNL